MWDGGPTASVSSSGRPDASERKHSPSGALADVSMADNPSTWLVNPTPNIANYYSIVPEASPVIDPLVASLRDCLLPPLLRVAQGKALRNPKSKTFPGAPGPFAVASEWDARSGAALRDDAKFQSSE